MDGFDPAGSFGPDVAARYDDTLRGDEAEAVAFLSDLAGDGAALELAIGTGRIGLPLGARGIRVDGIELSQDAQVRCFENAARHLNDGGVFVVEATPPQAWLRGH